MRALGFSFLVFLVVIVFGVFAHHGLTTGRVGLALFVLVTSLVLTAGICRAVVFAAKKEQKLALRAVAALMLIAAGCLFFDGLKSLFPPISYKVASIVAGGIPVLSGIIILTALKREPNQSPNPRGPS